MKKRKDYSRWRPLTLEECELKFVKGSFMELHRGRKHRDKGYKIKVKRSKAMSKGGKIACPLCYNGFRVKTLLSQHLKKVHKNDQEILKRTIKDHELTYYSEI